MTTTTKSDSRAGQVAEAVEEKVERNGWVKRVGRIGWLAKGFLYLLLAAIVFQVGYVGAFGGTENREASPHGALEQIASASFGRVTLLVLGGGLLLYSAWRVISALLPGDADAHALAKRAGYLFSATMYGVLGAIALHMGIVGERDAEDRTGTLLRGLMSHAWGRWLVGAFGVVALGSAIYFVYKGLSRRFEDQIDYDGMTRWHRALVDALGRVGWVARAAVVGLLGIFLVNAAVVYDTSNAKGLDGVLRDTADTTTGATLVLASGAGLAVYAVFCLVTWRRRILTGP